MNEKLWSPGKKRSCWIVWYEDQDGPGNMAVFYHKVEAENDIDGILRGVVSDELENWDPSDRDDSVTAAIELLESVIKDLDDHKVWDALSAWEDYHHEYDPDQTIHVEEGMLYGAP